MTLGFTGLTAREGSCWPLGVASVLARTLADQVGRLGSRSRKGFTRREPGWAQLTESGAGGAASDPRGGAASRASTVMPSRATRAWRISLRRARRCDMLMYSSLAEPCDK